MYRKRVDGSSTVEPLTSSNRHQDPASWSPDGTFLAYAEAHPENKWDIWLLDWENGQQPIPFLQTRFNEYHPMISPDGRWLAYSSDESGQPEVYVRPFPEGPGKWLISTGGGQEPLWSHDGNELYYRNEAQQTLMAVTLETSTSFVANKPVLLNEIEYASMRAGYGHPNYDVTRDGQFLMVSPVSERRLTPKKFNFVLNWFDELERLVPSGN